jgi:hypothetical protein
MTGSDFQTTFSQHLRSPLKDYYRSKLLEEYLEYIINILDEIDLNMIA